MTYTHDEIVGLYRVLLTDIVGEAPHSVVAAGQCQTTFEWRYQSVPEGEWVCQCRISYASKELERSEWLSVSISGVHSDHLNTQVSLIRMGDVPLWCEWVLAKWSWGFGPERKARTARNT